MGFEPATPCYITTALSTGLPNSPTNPQITTERFGINHIVTDTFVIAHKEKSPRLITNNFLIN